MKWQNKTILIVDDEPDICELITYEFEQNLCHIYCAQNGREAFKVAKETSPDLVISDVRMPNGDGIELLKNLKTLPENQQPAVILMTGYSDMSEERARQLGAAAIIYKPFDLKILFEMAQRLLAQNN